MTAADALLAVAPLSASATDRVRAGLLALLGPRGLASDVALSPAEWAGLDRLATLHRLPPLLHYLHRENRTIPPVIAARWQAAHRSAAVEALVLAGELRRTIALLDQAGLMPIALKGAWLAWHAYPRPALRPMRDLDILLTPETVIAGYELLCANGYRTDGPLELSLADAVRVDKHLPPLISPRGVMIELHQRLWEIAGRMDHAAPAANEQRLRARAIMTDGVRYLAPQDLLAHLIIHAAYDHRLDCGPLVVSDIAFLLQCSAIDWPRFWADAAAGHWQRGAHLVLAMVHDIDPAVPIAFPADLAPLPPDHAVLARRLLLQELDTRRSAGVAATLAARGLGAFFLRITARRPGAGEAPPIRRDLSGEGGMAAWAGTRLLRTLRELARPEVRGQSRALARLSRWLGG